MFSSTVKAEGILDGIGKMFDGNVDPKEAQKQVRQVSSNMVNESEQIGRKLGAIVMKESKDVSLAILLPVLLAEITFCGLRIMMKQSVAEQIGKMVIVTFILIVVMSLKPQTIIYNSMQFMRESGKDLGAKIILSSANSLTLNANELKNELSKAPTTPVPTPDHTDIATKMSDIKVVNDGREPSSYWLTWLGTPLNKAELEKNRDTYVNGTGTLIGAEATTEYRLSNASVMLRVWRDPSWVKDAKNMVPASMDNSVTAKGANDVGAFVDALTIVTQGGQIFQMAVNTAAIKTAATLSPAFMAMSILVGAIVCFHLVLCFGMATLPLVYFKSFANLWSQYLVALTALALVPFFYYVFSAVGFVFATNTYEVLFPLDLAANVPSLASISESVFISSLYESLSATPFISSGFAETASKMFSGLLQVMVHLGKLQFGVVLVTTFMASGVSFAMLAPSISFRWNQGFGSEQIFETTSKFFDALKGSVASGIGNIYGEGAQRIGSTVGSFMGNLGRK